MSQITAFVLGGGGGGNVLTLTGNSGGAVGPTAGNINVVGDGTTITVAGNPGTSTLTISSLVSSGITSITGNSGGAQSGPAITLTGGTSGGTFAGAANTLTMSFSELNLPNTSSSSTGVININSSRAFHVYGTNNVFAGSGAGNFTMTSVDNVGIGTNALTACNSDPGGNTAVGTNALATFNSGSNGGNAAFGQNSLISLTSGGFNIGFGTSSLVNLLTGNYSVGIGWAAGALYTGSESSNICINNEGTASENHTLHIGSGTGTGNQQLNQAFICGINGIGVTGTAVLVSTSDQLGIAVSSERYKDNIESMDDYSDDIMELRPVTFNYKNESEDQVSVGLIAEEVEEIMPSLVLKDKEGLPMTVKYLDLIPMLLNELQKVREELDTLREEFDASQEGD